MFRKIIIIASWVVAVTAQPPKVPCSGIQPMEDAGQGQGKIPQRYYDRIIARDGKGSAEQECSLEVERPPTLPELSRHEAILDPMSPTDQGQLSGKGSTSSSYYLNGELHPLLLQYARKATQQVQAAFEQLHRTVVSVNPSEERPHRVVSRYLPLEVYRQQFIQSQREDHGVQRLSRQKAAKGAARMLQTCGRHGHQPYSRPNSSRDRHILEGNGKQVDLGMSMSQNSGGASPMRMNPAEQPEWVSDQTLAEGGYWAFCHGDLGQPSYAFGDPDKRGTPQAAFQTRREDMQQDGLYFVPREEYSQSGKNQVDFTVQSSEAASNEVARTAPGQDDGNNSKGKHTEFKRSLDSMVDLLIALAM